MQQQGGFLSGVGGTLLRGLNMAIDGEAARRYPQQGGDVVTQDRSGRITSAGTPFRDTLEDVASNPWAMVGLAAALVLTVVLIKRLT